MSCLRPEDLPMPMELEREGPEFAHRANPVCHLDGGVALYLERRLSAQALLRANACRQGFAETVVEQPRWGARQQSHLLRQLQVKTNCIFRDLHFRVCAGGGYQLAQQVSG